MEVLTDVVEDFDEGFSFQVRSVFLRVRVSRFGGSLIKDQQLLGLCCERGEISIDGFML